MSGFDSYTWYWVGGDGEHPAQFGDVCRPGRVPSTHHEVYMTHPRFAHGEHPLTFAVDPSPRSLDQAEPHGFQHHSRPHRVDFLHDFNTVRGG